MSYVFKVLSNPTVKINNVIVAPCPNSVTVVEGQGETTVEGISLGGGLTGVTVSENIETKVSKIKMEFPNTTENKELKRTWKSVDLNIGNTISITEDDFHIVVAGAVVKNDPEMKFSADGKIDVEFHGAPAN